MCPQYLWIDTPHAYGRTTLKFWFLMGIFKFSDPMYMGSNVIVHQIQNFPYLLYIKLHLKMPGNEQLQISSPPTLGISDPTPVGIHHLREEVNWKKKRFLSGIARIMGEGGVYPCPNFLALFLEVHFWSIKRVYFFNQALTALTSNFGLVGLVQYAW